MNTLHEIISVNKELIKAFPHLIEELGPGLEFTCEHYTGTLDEYKGKLISITYRLSKNDDELIKNIQLISLIHGRKFGGCVIQIPALRQMTEQHPYYVQEMELPTTKDCDIDVKALREIIENFDEALILRHTKKDNKEINYFLPPLLKFKEEPIDHYVRRNDFTIRRLPELFKPDWSKYSGGKKYLELSDIIVNSNL